MRQGVTENGYSYKPFDETQSIFVHIPKCAGISVARTLYGGLAGGHTTFDEYTRTFEPRALIRYFKFTIVRNPWDRVVSAYHFLKSGGFRNKDREWSAKELAPFGDFDEFVLKWLNKENIWKWHHFVPQHYYILERRKRINLDFIARLERLDEDFSYICKKMNKSVVLGRSNSSNHGDYREYYSHKTKEIVADVYQEDIAFLRYTFDNS